jgi:hypothetical protein
MTVTSMKGSDNDKGNVGFRILLNIGHCITLLVVYSIEYTIEGGSTLSSIPHCFIDDCLHSLLVLRNFDWQQRCGISVHGQRKTKDSDTSQCVFYPDILLWCPLFFLLARLVCETTLVGSHSDETGLVINSNVICDIAVVPSKFIVFMTYAQKSQDRTKTQVCHAYQCSAQCALIVV